MTPQVDDPITRALAALDRFHSAHPDAVEAAVWQEARAALSEAQSERSTILTVVTTARKLIEDLLDYGGAARREDEVACARLAQAIKTSAEATAVDEAGASPHP